MVTNQNLVLWLAIISMSLIPRGLSGHLSMASSVTYVSHGHKLICFVGNRWSDKCFEALLIYRKYCSSFSLKSPCQGGKAHFCTRIQCQGQVLWKSSGHLALKGQFKKLLFMSFFKWPSIFKKLNGLSVDYHFTKQMLLVKKMQVQEACARGAEGRQHSVCASL